MRILARPIGLLLTGLVPALFLTLAFSNTAQAFECGNVGTGDETTQNDGSFTTALACGQNAAATGGNGTAVGGDAAAIAFDSTALGVSAQASGFASTALGSGASAIAHSSTALGLDAAASGFDSTALGVSAQASTSSSTALGRSASASGEDSTAVGHEAAASGDDSTALGRGALAPATRSTALGRIAVAISPNSTALGFGASAGNLFSGSVNNASAIGYRSFAPNANTVVLGSIPGQNDPEGTNEYVDVGIGTPAPIAPLHIRREDGTLEFLRLESDAMGGAQDRAMMDLTNNGGIRFQFTNTLTADAWRFQAGTGGNDNFEITKVGSGKLEMVLSPTGNMTIAGTLTEMSDVNAKQDIAELQGEMVLARLEQLPVSEWRYKASPESKHVGPMAQDFHAAFGLGTDDTHISPRDMAGVSLAAIKALRAQHEQAMTEKDSEIALLKADNASLDERLEKLEALVQVQR